MRILVTGSDGQIGKELLKLLDSHKLLLVDKKLGSNLNDKEVWKKIADFKPEGVFHLAASFDRLNEPPDFDKINWEDNMLATHNLLNCVGTPNRFVFASSYLVYDDSSPFIYELMSTKPRNMIGASKLWAEKAIDFKLQDTNVSHARIFRVYSKESHCFINHFVDVKKLGGSVNVWNTDGTFDFIHAKDVASALYSLFDSNVQGVFNVGTGTGHSVQDVINLIGVNTMKAEDYPRSERSIASIGKIKSMTGWSPTIELEKGIGELLT